MNKTFQIIDISWTQRVRPIYEESNQRYVFDAEDKMLSEKTGFYVIYGFHQVYGPDVLLYIGETKESETSSRFFIDRLGEHFSQKFWYFENLSYSLGTVKESLSVKDVKAVESILIAANRPAMNIKNIYYAKEESKDILVRNWDFKGVLAAECSGEYWCQY